MSHSGHFASVVTRFVQSRQTRAAYRGVSGEGSAVTFKDRNTSNDSRFDPGLENIPIQHHPEFISLRDNYGGFVDGNEVIWSPTLKSNTAARGFSGGSKDAEELNPMFGRQDYFSATGTYTHRYVSFSLAAAMARAGRIFTTGELPGRLGKELVFEGRNWYKAPSPFIDLTYVFEVMEIFWLSPDGGWPSVIYGGKSTR